MAPTGPNGEAFKLEIRRASLRDAAALASTFMAAFRDDVMMRFVYAYPPHDGPQKTKLQGIAWTERMLKMRGSLCDPTCHLFLAYDVGQAGNKSKGAKVAVGQAGFRLVKPKSDDPSVSSLVSTYQKHLRVLSTAEKIQAWLYSLHDGLATIIYPDWLYTYLNPEVKGIRERRSRWGGEVQEERDASITPEDKLRGYWFLSSMAVIPEYGRRGIGSKLMQWGLDKADEDDVAVYVAASGPGALMYAKHGFEELRYRLHVQGEENGDIDSRMMVRRRKSERQEAA